MIGGGKDDLANVDHMIAGAISGFVTRFLCQPFDVVKIRFQLQLDPIKASHPTAKYTGVWHGTVRILREEGVAAFWKGHIPAQMLSIVYGGVQFSSWEYLTRKFETGPGARSVAALAQQRQLHLRLCIGLHQHRCGATFRCHPHPPRSADGTQDVPLHRASGELHVAARGPDGLLPRPAAHPSADWAPLSGFQFAFYYFFVNLWELLLHPESHVTGVSQSVACGALSGFMSKTLVYPLDLIKKRLQVQGFTAHGVQFGRYTGFVPLHTLHHDARRRAGLLQGLLTQRPQGHGHHLVLLRLVRGCLRDAPAEAWNSPRKGLGGQ
ncbi:hypothetical protein MTO96_026846 [Rhipicephalus appendiculatus]